LSSRPVPHYLVLNRFDDEFGEYHRFVEPGSCRLAYLTLAEGLGVLDVEGALETVVVPDLGFETLLPLAQGLARRWGGFQGVVGISEYDLLTAARLRAALGTPGWSAEFVTGFRDKPRMKELVGAAGLRVPRFRELDGSTTAEDVSAALGLPVIVKPRAGAASHGVVRADSGAELARALARVDPAQYECEEYIDGQVLHVDGVRRGGRFHFVSASAYVNTCLDFALGKALGSVLLDGGEPRDRVVGFAAGCLDALGLVDGPFHLELFRTGAGELVFLEVGLRPGGAEVAFIHRDLFGIDLFSEAFRTCLGLPALTASGDFPSAVSGGWVSVPEPEPLPSRVLSRTSLRALIPEVYAEVVPDVGTVFDGNGGYDHIGGRFRLRGPDQHAVRRAALEVMARYELVCEPVETAGSLT
jgi:ATP-grasp domain